MKTWARESHAKGDLYHDEEPVAPPGICDQYRAMKSVWTKVPREGVNDVLEALGLRKRP